MKTKLQVLPVQRVMCKTCPWRHGSPYAALIPHLTESALTESNRICHSTGSSGILGDTHKPDKLCRGARNVQLRFFAEIGFLDEPTDAAWNNKIKEIEKSRQSHGKE